MRLSESQDKSAFWKNLDEDIDRIGRKVKQNLQNYDRNVHEITRPKIANRSFSQPRKISKPSLTLTGSSFIENKKRVEKMRN